MLTKRQFLLAAAALPILGMRPAFAGPYPEKPIRIIVPASPGTSIDAVTRFFSEPLSKALNTPVIVENKSGAGGLMAYTSVAKSAPDGYTIILTGTPLYLLPLYSAQQDPPVFDPAQDFTPIARVARVPYAIVVGADSPYRSMQDLVQGMTEKPDTVTYSSQGVGSSAHLCSVILNDMSKTRARHIGYKETTMAVTDVVGGRISFTCQTSVGVLPLVNGGRLRALAVTTADRWEALPSVPTVAESGVPGFEVSSQLDFMAPAGTPEPVLKVLSDELTRIAATQAFKDFCSKQILTHEVMGSREMQPVLAAETARWKRVVAVAKGE
ncbi:tripartite tricarboxylate transporter substrate binding protein [Bordetella sp. 2513F-2]